MNVQQRRRVSFGGSAVAIEYSGSRPAAIVDFLFQRVPTASGVPPHVTYRIEPGSQPERLALYRDATLIYEGDSEATLAELLLGDTCHHLADKSQGGLLFHAAGLARQGQGLLLPGGIGAGKSTLAAWLATRGLEYLTDELVFVPWGSHTMQALVRPLNLKSTSRAVLQGHLEEHTAYMLSSPHADLILPQSIGTLWELPLSLIIFPHYEPGSEFAWRALSKAQAGLALMQCLTNARNLPEHGFSEIARLAKAAPAYSMSYASLGQIMIHGQRKRCEVIL